MAVQWRTNVSGMGAIVLDNAVIGTGSIVGAGALVTAGSKFPPHSMILGAPAKRVRSLRSGEAERWIFTAVMPI